jgi:hypothetical protein
MDDLVTLADHEAGFKDLPVRSRGGREETVRLHAPRRRDARLLPAKVVEIGDIWAVVAACRPTVQGEVKDEAWIDQLETGSGDRVEIVAICLAFGAGFQKKMKALTVANLMGLLTPGTTSTSGAPDSPPPK